MAFAGLSFYVMQSEVLRKNTQNLSYGTHRPYVMPPLLEMLHARHFSGSHIAFKI